MLLASLALVATVAAEPPLPLDARRKPAIKDALSFRARRQSLFEGAAALARALENNEGLAECTGYALRGTIDEETRLGLARRRGGRASMRRGACCCSRRTIARASD